MSEDIEDIEELRETLREEISALRGSIMEEIDELRDDITEEINYLRERLDSVERSMRVVDRYKLAFRDFLSEVNLIRSSIEDDE